MRISYCISVLLLIALGSVCTIAAQINTLQGGAITIRKSAVNAVLPEYPQTTLASRKQGLVVVEVTINPSGHVQSLNVLQTFDEGASKSVISAVNQWQFVPTPKDGRLDNAQRIGKLLFQFTMNNGKPIVIDLAEEAIISGRVFEAPMQDKRIDQKQQIKK